MSHLEAEIEQREPGRQGKMSGILVAAGERIDACRRDSMPG